MNYHPVIVLVRCMLIGCVMTSSSDAYEESNSSASPEYAQRPAATRVFSLENMQPHDAANVVSQIFSGLNERRGNSLRFAPDERTKSLVATGDAELLDSVETLLLQLDKLADSKKANELRVLQLKNIPATDALTATKALGLKNTRVQADTASNSLLVNGLQEEMMQLNRLVQTLDEDLAPRRHEAKVFRIVWLVDSSLMPDNAAAVPSDLQVPIKKLSEKVGMGELRTAGQFVINAAQSEQPNFQTTGSVQLMAQPCVFTFNGRHDARTERLQVEISAESMGSEQRLCTLNTVVQMQPGHPVILGMSSIDSKASVFVIEMMEKATSDGAH